MLRPSGNRTQRQDFQALDRRNNDPCLHQSLLPCHEQSPLHCWCTGCPDQMLRPRVAGMKLWLRLCDDLLLCRDCGSDPGLCLGPCVNGDGDPGLCRGPCWNLRRSLVTSHLGDNALWQYSYVSSAHPMPQSLREGLSWSTLYATTGVAHTRSFDQALPAGRPGCGFAAAFCCAEMVTATLGCDGALRGICCAGVTTGPVTFDCVVCRKGQAALMAPPARLYCSRRSSRQLLRVSGPLRIIM